MRTMFKWDLPSRHGEKQARKTEAEANWRLVCAAVDKRDGKACRHCDKRSDPDAVGLLSRGHRHHIVYRSAGGPDSTENVVTICAAAHDAEHRHQLKIEGNADVALQFFQKNADGGWFLIREESAVRVVRKD